MRLRYKLSGVAVVCLTANAYYSDSASTFFAHLFGYGFVAVVFLFGFSLINYLIVPNDTEKLFRLTAKLVESVKSRVINWWNKPRPLLDTIIDLLTKPITRERLIREANTGQLELQLDE